MGLVRILIHLKLTEDEDCVYVCDNRAHFHHAVTATRKLIYCQDEDGKISERGGRGCGGRVRNSGRAFLLRGNCGNGGTWCSRSGGGEALRAATPGNKQN